MQNKRKHERVRISFPVRCEKITSKDYFYTVFKDISQGGIKVISDEFIKTDKPIRFEINFVNQLIKGKGRIAWCTPETYSERYLAGIEFTEVNKKDHQTLSNFLANISPS
jgi:c-di-GMP-binding flagellar brake protein YcgR